jgi:hypothetical protein
VADARAQRVDPGVFLGEVLTVARYSLIVQQRYRSWIFNTSLTPFFLLAPLVFVANSFLVQPGPARQAFVQLTGYDNYLGFLIVPLASGWDQVCCARRRSASSSTLNSLRDARPANTREASPLAPTRPNAQFRSTPYPRGTAWGSQSGHTQNSPGVRCAQGADGPRLGLVPRSRRPLVERSPPLDLSVRRPGAAPPLPERGRQTQLEPPCRTNRTRCVLAFTGRPWWWHRAARAHSGQPATGRRAMRARRPARRGRRRALYV